MPLPLSRPIREAIGKKTFSHLDRSKTAEWLVLLWQPATYRWKRRLITNFHCPQIKKQQQAKQGLWGWEVGPEIHPKDHKGASAKQINQSLRHLPGAVHANGHRACQAVGLGAGLQCFPPYRPELHQSAALGSVKGNKVECAPQTICLVPSFSEHQWKSYLRHKWWTALVGRPDAPGTSSVFLVPLLLPQFMLCEESPGHPQGTDPKWNPTSESPTQAPQLTPALMSLATCRAA